MRGARNLLPRVSLRFEGGDVPQSGDLWAIGMRRPVPNAFAETFRPGAACRLLYSERSIMPRDLLHEGARRSARAGGRGDGEVALHETLEDRVEDGVGRQGVLVRLAGPELGGRRLHERRLRDQRTSRPAR